MALLGRQIAVDHIDFKPGSDSNLTDPHTKVPAPADRQTGGSEASFRSRASSTDDDAAM
jgi:hypothetical protein